MQENFKSGFVTLIGRPNVGKSTLMNKLIGQKIAITSNKPQTTRNNIQTILTTQDYQIVFLDTPGILWPKFEDPKTGINLAYCGSIKDEIMDIATLAMELIGVLAKDYPELLKVIENAFK